MNKTTLIVMAAGLGTRYAKGGVKQLDPVGPNGEVIMDYSIYDAITAGFDKAVFVIRRDIKQLFDDMIGSRIAEKIDTDYVYQDIADVPSGFEGFERVKPWGTAHAVYACRNKVKEPFTVINADDAYGSEAFKVMHDFLASESLSDGGRLHLAMPGFILSNTISRSGTVTRGVCEISPDKMLKGVTETYGIGFRGGELTALASKNSEETRGIDPSTLVSMNMWGCPAEFIDKLGGYFEKFLSEHGNEPNSEYLLPAVISDMLKNGEADCRLFETGAKWFGMTSPEDKIAAQQEIKEQIAVGIYPESLI